ncbi:MAG: ribosomal L7Ae/L30e/S12e/Gadd45 family protein [Oscillospiraceae bacterium]|nr:ribosomal L7Ae/L30e/S12e/Gadd45 family protein [Oscillospiraceae bacterium]
MNEPCLGLLGLAKKGGMIQAGETAAGTLCRSGKAKLVLLAEDAAENTRRRAESFARMGGVPLVRLPYGKEQIGFALGRASCALAALSDQGMADALVKKLAQADADRNGSETIPVKTEKTGDTAPRSILDTHT